MTIIIDNEDPQCRPDPPAPAGLNKSAPSHSDTIRFEGKIENGKPGSGSLSSQTAVSFRRIVRDRTWANLVQFQTSSHHGGDYAEEATEGVSTATTALERWEATLGVKASAGWGPLSVAVSASLSVGREHSVTVDLHKSITRKILFDFKEGVNAEIVAWQLGESYVLSSWFYVWPSSDGVHRPDVTDAMIETARQEIADAVREGREPNRLATGRPGVDQSHTLPTLLSETSQYTMTSYPKLSGSDVRLTTS